MTIDPRITLDITLDKSIIELFVGPVLVSTIEYEAGIVTLSERNVVIEESRENFLMNNLGVREWLNLTLQSIPEARTYIPGLYGQLKSELEIQDDGVVEYRYENIDQMALELEWNPGDDLVTVGTRDLQTMAFREYLILNAAADEFAKIINQNAGA